METSLLNKHHRGLFSLVIIEQPLSQLRLALDFVVNDILDTPPQAKHATGTERANPNSEAAPRAFPSFENKGPPFSR